MVASAYEFIEICEKHDFHNLVISMKASNTLVMVHAYRMLCKEMLERGRIYPLHLGVTEAGDGEDGRIKSAVGIGALLEDGIGDTVRVSLTEDPEFEIPVAQKLIAKYSTAHPIKTISPNRITFNPYAYEKRKSTSIENIGGKNHPIVIADYSKRHPIEPKNLYGIGYNYSEQLDKWNLSDLAADYLYIGDNTINFELPGTLRTIVDFENYTFGKTNSYPLVANF
jgi:(E)-4-hydroxy-3-methylbut-2-enyl-diphosphate synthase